MKTSEVSFLKKAFLNQFFAKTKAKKSKNSGPHLERNWIVRTGESDTKKVMWRGQFFSFFFWQSFRTKYLCLRTTFTADFTPVVRA